MTIAQVGNRIDQLQASLDILDKVHHIPAYITVTGISYLPNENQFDTYCEEISHWHSKIFFLFRMSNLPQSWILNICNKTSTRYPNEPLFIRVYLISHHIKRYVNQTITSYLEHHNHSYVHIQ
jgi:hypothetical protein